MSTMAVLSAHVTTQRARQVQASGSGCSGSLSFLFFQPASDMGCTVFKLPVELFPEVFSHLYDHRQYIRDSLDDTGGIIYGVGMKAQHVERSTVIRNLTMTCWVLRNALLPALWKHTEGCVVESSPNDGGDEPRKTYGLYAQCIYLLSNPTIAAYVQ